jgi:hypothetical protein
MAMVAAVALGVGVVAGGSAVYVLRPVPMISPVSQLTITLPESDDLVENNSGSELALSPDGSTLVYAANRGGRRQLFRRAMSSLESIPIRGTDDANFPVLSPDGRAIAFVRGSQVLRMSLEGGPATMLYQADQANNSPNQLRWTPNDIILFDFTGNDDGLMQVPASGGAASPHTKIDSAAGETDHRQPDSRFCVLGSRCVFLFAGGPSGPPEQRTSTELEHEPKTKEPRNKNDNFIGGSLFDTAAPRW